MPYKFYECHSHIALDGVSAANAERRYRDGTDIDHTKEMFAAYKNAGIEFLRDGGDKWDTGARAKWYAEEYGITFLTPVFPIFKKGNYGGFLGRAYESISDYRALVQEAAEKGADFIKLMLTGIMDFDRFGVLTGFSIPEDEMRELVNIAHGEGFAVMAHVNGTDPVKSAVDAGVDSVEHGNFADGSAVRALIDAGCVWVPTLAPTWNFVGKGVFPDEVLLKIEEFQTGAIRSAAEQGALIAPGSDAGAAQVPHAQGLLDEAGYLCKVIGERYVDVLLRGQEEIKKRFRRQ